MVINGHGVVTSSNRLVTNGNGLEQVVARWQQLLATGHLMLKM